MIGYSRIQEKNSKTFCNLMHLNMNSGAMNVILQSCNPKEAY